MMKKLFSIVAILCLLATSSYGLNLTDTGHQHKESVWIKGTDGLTSGSVVILQTSSPTYWGREVTGTETIGLPIYGVYDGSETFTPAQMVAGRWINIIVSGYTPIVRVGSGNVTVALRSNARTSGTVFVAEAVTAGAGEEVTGSVIILEAKTPEASSTCKALLRGL